MAAASWQQHGESIMANGAKAIENIAKMKSGSICENQRQQRQRKAA